MSSESYDPSVWDHPENDRGAPKFCPHCDAELAHPDDLRDNEEITASGLFTAYRRHRHAHFPWGDNPKDDWNGRGDPYLATSYDGDKSAMWEPTEDKPSGDPEEVVGHVFDVRIAYETELRATVVATDKHRAKEKAKELKSLDKEDLTGQVPERYLTHEIHGEADKRQDVTRSDDRAERMDGWPW